MLLGQLPLCLVNPGLLPLASRIAFSNQMDERILYTYIRTFKSVDAVSV